MKIIIDVEEIKGDISLHIATQGMGEATRREREYGHSLTKCIAEVVIPRMAEWHGAKEVIKLSVNKPHTS